MIVVTLVWTALMLAAIVHIVRYSKREQWLVDEAERLEELAHASLVLRAGDDRSARLLSDGAPGSSPADLATASWPLRGTSFE